MAARSPRAAGNQFRARSPGVRRGRGIVFRNSRISLSAECRASRTCENPLLSPLYQAQFYSTMGLFGLNGLLAAPHSNSNSRLQQLADPRVAKRRATYSLTQRRSFGPPGRFVLWPACAQRPASADFAPREGPIFHCTAVFCSRSHVRTKLPLLQGHVLKQVAV